MSTRHENQALSVHSAASNEQPIANDNVAFFNTGIIGIHFNAIRGNDSQLTKAEAAELTRRNNRPNFLKRNFIDHEPLHRRYTPDGLVQIMSPSAPYAYGGVMVVAAGEALFNAADDELVKTEMPFDLEGVLGHEYYKQILASIQAQEDVSLPRQDNHAKVVAYENSIASISTPEHRLPRTIALPHAHIIKGGDWINGEFNQPRASGFKVEQEFLQDEELFKKFDHYWMTKKTQDNLDIGSGLSPELALRSRVPFGYTIDTKITRTEPLSRQSQQLMELLQFNHRVYTDFMNYQISHVDKTRKERREAFSLRKGIVTLGQRSVAETIVLQPSYRTYIYYHDDKLAVTIAPMILACVGGLETMDLAVDRGLQYEHPFSEEEMAQFTVDFIQRAQALLDT